MNESDYLKIAQEKRQEDLMDDYWSKVIRTRKWISKDGTETYFKDLDLKHILNIINGLQTFNHPRCKDVVKCLVQELTVRIKRKPPHYALDSLENLRNLVYKLSANEETRRQAQEYYNNIKEGLGL